MSKRAAAEALAKKGFHVFPVEANGKKPAIDDWPSRAINDPERVREWWTEATGEERDWNIGILCDDLLVIDIDAKGNLSPDDVLKDLEAEFGALPVVSTPSGGYHAYFRLPDGVSVGNTAKKIGPTIDTRSFHGYVLGPGSTIGNRAYGWVESTLEGNVVPSSIADLPPAPQRFIDASEKPKVKAPVDDSIEWDTPAATKWAENYLLHEAPHSVMGQAGDATALNVAMKLRDKAISRDAAIVLMLGEWNQRCEPPWSVEDLDKKVENAYRYGKNSPTPSAVPGAEFEAVIDRPAVNFDVCPIFIPEGDFDPATLPKREWLIEGVFARGCVTLINAPPGSGKTQWLAQMLLGVVHNRSDVAGFPVIEPTTAWMFNAEDSMDELRRRVAAAKIHFKLNHNDASFAFGLSSGIDDDLCVAKWDAAKQRVLRNDKAIKALTKQIVDNKIGLLILDPMADLHEVPESSNDAIKIVIKMFTQVAIDLHCAIGIATHTRKLSGASAEGHAGNMDSIRGAGAQGAKARVIKSLMPMTEKEAKAAKIDLETRGSYLRIDTAKNTYGPNDRGARPAWFKWESVPLGNEDKVGVLTFAEIATSRLRQEVDRSEVLATILASMPESAKQVSWPKTVLPQFVRQAVVSESYARKWFSSLETETETTKGVITKIDKAGAGGAMLRFLLKEEKDDEDDVFA